MSERQRVIGGVGSLAVPMEFLSEEHAAAFGRFAVDPSRVDLERFFFPDDVDRRCCVRRDRAGAG